MSIYNSYESSILLPHGTLYDFMRHVGQLQSSFTAEREIQMTAANLVSILATPVKL